MSLSPSTRGFTGFGTGRGEACWRVQQSRLEVVDVDRDWGAALLPGSEVAPLNWLMRRSALSRSDKESLSRTGEGLEEVAAVGLAFPARGLGSCVHSRYFDEHRVGDLEEIDEDPPSAVIFLQRIVPCGSLHTLFSVESMSAAALRGRAIVSHTGTQRDTGKWKCNKDSGSSSCSHIKKARELLPEDLSSIPGVGQAGDEEIEVAASANVFV
ncbi:hypothetical protein NMY22_g16401 [Coprinellus aureogranulatus]|nr:hypothetical protein NMY22_g16401 [Coprinellus aureogranulatus]